MVCVCVCVGEYLPKRVTMEIQISVSPARMVTKTQQLLTHIPPAPCGTSVVCLGPHNYEAVIPQVVVWTHQSSLEGHLCQAARF